MRKKQRLKELTIKDNFMFGAVMTEPGNCKGFLERALELPDTFVIFICDFDPFGKQKYRYTFNVRCKVSHFSEICKSGSGGE